MIGSAELILILCVVLLLFGGKKLPEFARNLGKGFHEFKRACQGFDPEEEPSTPSDPTLNQKDPKEISRDRP